MRELRVAVADSVGAFPCARGMLGAWERSERVGGLRFVSAALHLDADCDAIENEKSQRHLDETEDEQ